jgi:hypothetical protein
LFFISSAHKKGFQIPVTLSGVGGQGQYPALGFESLTVFSPAKARRIDE